MKSETGWFYFSLVWLAVLFVLAAIVLLSSAKTIVRAMRGLVDDARVKARGSDVVDRSVSR